MVLTDDPQGEEVQQQQQQQAQEIPIEWVANLCMLEFQPSQASKTQQRQKQQTTEIGIDSMASISVCPRDFGGELADVIRKKPLQKLLRTATGQQVQRDVVFRKLYLEMEDGFAVQHEFEETNVLRPILAMGKWRQLPEHKLHLAESLEDNDFVEVSGHRDALSRRDGLLLWKVKIVPKPLQEVHEVAFAKWCLVEWCSYGDSWLGKDFLEHGQHVRHLGRYLQLGQGR